VENKSGQGILKNRGVVLRRSDTPEGNRSVYVLLENVGPVWLLAPGAARGKVRFGGSTDPLVWGTFHVYRGPNRWYLRDVDVRKDFWSLRSSSIRIRQAVHWVGSILGNTLPGHPCNDLLPVFFWSLSLLENPSAREDLASWRFYWRWLRIWGMAPELERCRSCGSLPRRAVFSGEGINCEKCGGQGIPLSEQERLALLEAAISGHRDFIERSGQSGIGSRLVEKCTLVLERELAERT